MARKPFFMRFIEKQQPQVEVKTDVKAGAEDGGGKKKKKWYEDKGLETMKYPSDNDEEYIEW